MTEAPHRSLFGDAEVEETHLSWVYLRERDVYKIKKPLDLGFVDFTTLEARRRACEAEVELNRRLAPEVYLGVAPITADPGGRLRLGGDGEPVEYAVHMLRLPVGARGDHRLQAGRLGRDHLARVAERLARFHDAARSDAETERFGAPDSIGRNVRENFRQTRDSIAEYLPAQEAAEIERWQLGFLERWRDLFLERAARGHVRDGHGDLRLEHLYLIELGAEPLEPGFAVDLPGEHQAPEGADEPEGGGGAAAGGAAVGIGGPGTAASEPEVVIVDCIEFNERFRYADVCADVAFLSMDLARHGRTDLAEHFLARYARAANDYDLYPLVDFYQSYRAYVRGKVSAILATDAGAGAAARARAAEDARLHFKLALASERPSLLDPVVIAVGGPIASGKSTIAEWVAMERSAPVVDTDRTRKALLGVEPTQKVWHPPFRDGYAPEMTAQVYQEVLRRAAAVLESGRAVVLDASFRAREERAAARRLAHERSSPFLFVECAADAPTLRQRLQERSRRTGVSDGRLEILDEFLAQWEPVDELPPDEHLKLDTTRPLEESQRALRERIALWPGRLPG